MGRSARSRRMPPPRRTFRRDRPPGSTVRKPMLAQGRKTHFLYDLKQILRETTLDDAALLSWCESLFARGARTGTENAFDFVKAKLDDGTFTRDQANAIASLIDRYTIMR